MGNFKQLLITGHELFFPRQFIDKAVEKLVIVYKKTDICNKIKQFKIFL